MVNLEGFKADRYEGVIETVEEMPLKDYLETDEKIEAFKKGMTLFPSHLKTRDEKETYKEARLDSNVLVVGYSITVQDVKKENKEFFNIPTITGWGRSKLKDLQTMNQLPNDTKDWVQKKVYIYINKEGYLRLLPDK